MQCLYPVPIYIKTDKAHSRFRSQNLTDTRTFVRCRHCVVCIDERIREWTYRLMAESKSHQKMAFITLTYDDEHIPDDGSCCIKDLQNFFKRVRRFYDYQRTRDGKSETTQEIENLSYFGCSEYGGTFGRPHLHCLILGLDYNDLFPKNKQRVSHNTVNCNSRFWKKGLLNYGDDVTLTDSRLIRYVTKYIEKLDTQSLYKYCDIMGIERPKVVHSVGLGSDYLSQSVNENGEIPKINGLRISLPPYWSKKLGYAPNHQDWLNSQIYNETKLRERNVLMQGTENTDAQYAQLVERAKRGIL